MKVGNYHYDVDWAHLIVVTTVMGLMIAYLMDARSTSLAASNLIFIQPLTIAAFLLYLAIIPQAVKRRPLDEAVAAPAMEDEPEDETPSAAQREESWTGIAKIGLLVVAFGCFVFGIETFGFDVCSWAFFLVGLYICGERNWLALLLFPPVATVAFFYGFRLMVPYPMTTMFL